MTTILEEKHATFRFYDKFNKIEDEYCGTSSQEWKVANTIVEGSFSRIGNYLWKRDRK